MQRMFLMMSVRMLSRLAVAVILFFLQLLGQDLYSTFVHGLRQWSGSGDFVQFAYSALACVGVLVSELVISMLSSRSVIRGILD